MCWDRDLTKRKWPSAFKRLKTAVVRGSTCFVSLVNPMSAAAGKSPRIVGAHCAHSQRVEE